MHKASLTAVLFAVVALAGCADPQSEAAHDADGHTHDDDSEHGHMMEHIPWSMSLNDCEEGGFVALYAMGEGETLAGVWKLADIREEVGNPVRNGMGGPITGPQKGNWHQGFRCAGASTEDHSATNFQMGWVGDMVEAPGWDTGGADVHFLISGLGLMDTPLRDSLLESTTADITHSLRAEVEWYSDNAVYTVYDDLEKGTYESYSLIEPLREVEPRVIRLWWTVPADGGHANLAAHGHGGGEDEHPEGKWKPVYWDIKTSGGQQLVTPKAHSVEAACHSGTDDHGPQGGACQPTLTTVYNHGHIDLVWGGVIHDVTLDEVWLH